MNNDFMVVHQSQIFMPGVVPQLWQSFFCDTPTP